MLSEHLDRYRALVLAIAQVIWTHGPSGEMVGQQPSWAAFTGQTLEQYSMRGWRDAVHPDDRDANVQAWNRALASGAAHEREERLRRYDGQC